MMKSRSNRPDRDAERLGDLVERQVEVVVQDHNRAMVDGEPLESALELVAIDDRARAIRCIGSSEGIRRMFGVHWRFRRPSA